MPRLHEIKLCESPVIEGDDGYERFDRSWYLDTTSSSSSASSAMVIRPGDVLYIPELLTGAGELEAMRFVGPPTSTDHEESSSSQDSQHQEETAKNLLPLYGAGVEYPEFPQAIIAINDGRRSESSSLRDDYADLLDAMLAKMTGGPNTLQELMGGGMAEVDEYWNHPPVLRQRDDRSG